MNRGRTWWTLWRTLTADQRRRCLSLQLVSVAMAVSTVCGLAAVMSFLAMLANPGFLDSNAALAWLEEISGLPRAAFLRALGAGFIALLVLVACVNLLGARALGRFAYQVGDRIRGRLFAGYLAHDWMFHARTGAPALLDDVLGQSDRVIVAVFNAQLLATHGMLAMLVVASIAWVDAVVALGGASVVAVTYLLLYRGLRPRVMRNARAQTRYGGERLLLAEQSLRGLKFLRVSGARAMFETRFDLAARALSRAYADTQFVGQFPRYLFECLAGIGLIACAALLAGDGQTEAWLVKLSFIGFAGFRLLSAMQQVYHAWINLRAQAPALRHLAAQLAGTICEVEAPAAVPRAPLRSLVLERVSFHYQGAQVLDAVTMHVAAGEAVGITGPSGGGKTTLLDLALGLSAPRRGRVLVDGLALDHSSVSAWQSRIGYVPQELMIFEGTVRENIAFGRETADIDDVRLRQAARLAGAAEFIEALPQGYDTQLPASGRVLSGGQRQRLGIARALYHDPVLLVFDEATNALDADSGRILVEAIVRNLGERALLLVAHAPEVLAACDRVYELREGCLRERLPAPGRASDAPMARHK
jgi:ATP-binding cassette, subfamily B, bacterial PglK